MLGILRNRLLQALPVILGIVVFSYVLLSFAPGDMVDIMATEAQIGDPAKLAELREKYGLNDPLWLQVVRYLGAVMRLDLGVSHLHNEPVVDVILQRLPATLLLMGAALGIAVVLGVSAGVIAATRVGTWIDSLVSLVAILVFAAPAFWLGLMMIVVFSVKLGWLPIGGFASVGVVYEGLWHKALDVGRHLILPAMALGMFYAGVYARVTRAAMLDVYQQDYVRTARAKGVKEMRIALRHVLRNALLPVVTLIGLQLGTALGGAVVIEAVFNWPGIGTLVFDAVMSRNLPVVMGVLLFSSVVVILANLVVDLLYSWLDPRIGHAT